MTQSPPDQAITPSQRPVRVQAPSGLGPLIKNAWYVVAARADVGRELRQITVLNEPLVYFRAEDGEPVVLDDRCPHRRFSLAKSHLKGDTIQCAYHGLTFDRTGACIFAPGVTGELHFGVRQYTAVERGLWLWVWMGDPDRADPAQIPLDDTSGEWYGPSGYTLNQCNYLLMHENLLDLTHLHYLHGPHVADETYATTPPTALESTDPNAVGHSKDVRTALSIFAVWCGTDPATLVRRTESVWSLGPSFHRADQEYRMLDGTPATPGKARVLHAITPETSTTTHQFWTLQVDSPTVLDDEELQASVHGVFQEDVEVLALQNRYVAADTRQGIVVENSIPTDVHGVKFRRVLQRLARSEAAGA
ncbi:Rieske 2Fe-2S domain-containing protein [Streptomyces mirabilis]|uniref:Rieske 2Fe-2S domain-containing protein n=1 Tax=Streptomyces mirabilis TaxID=68239 RepID=UPI003654E14B